MSLLAAALLFVSSAALGPWVHLLATQQESVQSAPAGDSERGKPGPHSEQGCALFHSLLQIALPGSGSPVLHAALAEPSAPAELRFLYSPPSVLRPQARAPPSSRSVRAG